MKKLVLTCLLLGLWVSASYAALKVIGQKDNMQLDTTGFSPAMKANYEILKVKCSNKNCHSLERTITALQTGVAPISGQPFDRNATKAYGVKMLRKPDSGMNKQEVKATVELMNYLLDLSEQK
jgi:hypothetical protein